MDGSFFPPVERVKYYDNGVAKDVKKLPKPWRNDFKSSYVTLETAKCQKREKTYRKCQASKSTA